MKEGEKDVSAADLMIEGLFKLNIETFDELVKQSGKAKALVAVKPYRRWAARISVREAIKRLNIQGNGPDAMLLVHAFNSLAIVPPDKMEGEIKEKGAVGINRDCIFKNASPELCISLSNFSSESEAEIVNPEYECIWTHHESSGDPFCRYVFKKKSDPISVLDDMGKTQMVLPKFEASKEQVQAARLWALGGFFYIYTCAFLDLHGEEKTDEIIGGVAKRIGQEIGLKLAMENPELKESAESVGKLVRAMQNSMGQKDEFLIASSDEVSNEIADCSWAMLPNHPGATCTKLECFFRGMVGAINPDFEFAYDGMITHGEEVCHWTVKRKTSSKQADDPLKVLKMRFAKGEITKEDYLEMKALLEE